mgnify:FL=1
MRDVRTWRGDHTYWDGDTLVEPEWADDIRNGHKIYMPVSRLSWIESGHGHFGPDPTLEIRVDLWREDFGPTQVPDTSERVDWFLAGLDPDRRAFAETLLDMIERW